MRRIVGMSLVAVVIAGCSSGSGRPSTPVEPADGATATVAVASTTSTPTSSPQASAPPTTAPPPTTSTSMSAPAVDVDLSELDETLDRVEQILGEIDLDEDEGDLP